MNVIIANKKQDLLKSLNFDIIKTMYGQFTVDEIIETFKNFFFQRMILDITAIKGYTDIKNLQKLSIALDMDKIILVLDETSEGEEGTQAYLSKLISMGIYNFTKNIDGIMYLYNNPNTYRDVAQYHQIDNTIEVEHVYINGSEPKGVRVVGVKNVTDNSGATTLIYLMLRQLSKNYDVIALEVDKNDFMHFKNKNMITTSSEQLGNLIAKYSEKDVILVDINNSSIAMGMVDDILYLVEPSLLKLNRLMLFQPKIFAELRDKKIVVNQSVLSPRDVLDFESAIRTKTFYSMPPLNERDRDIAVVDAMLFKMGFLKQQNEAAIKRKKILGIF